MSDRRLLALGAARVLDLIGARQVGPALPCGQHYAIGCALTCLARGPCLWWVAECNGPALLEALRAAEPSS